MFIHEISIQVACVNGELAGILPAGAGLMNVCVAGEGELLSEQEARIYGQLYYLKTEATVNSPRVIYESLYGK